MGGKTAMVCALRYPHLVDRLAVLDVAPVSVPGTSETEDVVEALRTLRLASFQNKAQVEKSIQSLISVRGWVN